MIKSDTLSDFNMTKALGWIAKIESGKYTAQQTDEITKSSNAKSTEAPKMILRRGPPTPDTVTALGKDFVSDLKYLKKNDQADVAREIVDDIVALLKAADLLEE
jgi:hypothetical protein